MKLVQVRRSAAHMTSTSSTAAGSRATETTRPLALLLPAASATRITGHSLKVREENIMRQRARFFAVFLLVTIWAASLCAQAANLTVNCDKKETINKAVKFLADTNPQGPKTVSVSGSCRENVLRRLPLA